MDRRSTESLDCENDRMPQDDWVTIAQYSNPMAAGIASGLLTGLSIPNRVLAWPRSPLFDLWVPPQFADDAKKAVEESDVPDAELTKPALSYPRPDD